MLSNYKSTIITCERNSILVFSLVLIRFLMYAIGNTKAALPINTNANKVELTATEIPALLQQHGNVLRK